MQKAKKWFNKFNYVENAPTKAEFIIAFLILLFAAYMFCFTKDFKLTVTQGLDFNDCLFHGKVFQYYSEINKLALAGHYSKAWPQTLLAGANYTIINYASLGLICMPAYLIGKLFHITIPYLVYVAIVKTAFVAMMLYMTKIVYDIVMLVCPDKKEGGWTALCFLTSPIFLFASIIISHMDIFSTLFLLLGIKYMIRKNRKLELVFFMIAATYKPFVLLGIIPVLFLQEKRVLYLARDFVVTVLGILLQKVVYHFDPGYLESQKFMSETYGFIGRFFGVGFAYKRNCYDSTVSYFVLIFILVCVAAYLIKKVRWEYTLALPFVVMASFVMFVQWHPNWMVLLVPYMILMYAFTSNIRVNCILECVTSLFIIILTALGWLHNYDARMINGGVISKLFHLEINNKYMIHKVLLRKFPDIPIDIYASVLCGAVGAMVILYVLDCYRRRRSEKDVNKQRQWERIAVWCRVLPTVGFMAYALLICFI